MNNKLNITGWWTEQLINYADSITAIDASQEVIAINRNRLEKFKDKIKYQQQDLFSWNPNNQYDVIFFSFWLSHVSPSLFDHFWNKIRSALKPEGRIFFIDSLPEPTATASNQTFDKENFTNIRKLNNEREFSMVKIFYDPKKLQDKLLNLGWHVEVKTTSKYFFYGKTRN